MNFPVPILPFKFVGFTHCTHVITFLEDDEYDSVEFMCYDNSVSGEGIELILTERNSNQTIFANNSCNYLNIMKSGRSVCKSDIDIHIVEQTYFIKVDLTCVSAEHKIEISFESLFPVSDLRAGKVDPKHHSSKGMPFMYSSQNTVGKRADITIDGRKVKAKLSNDPMLSQVKGLQSYLSKNFNLGVISPQEKDICFEAQKNGVFFYKTSNNNRISFRRDEKIGVLKCSNFTDKCEYEYIFSDENEQDLQTIRLKYEGQTKLALQFQENLNTCGIKNKESEGNILLEFEGCSETFFCEYLAHWELKESSEKEGMIVAMYTIKHENPDWEERCRVLRITMLYIIQNPSHYIKEAIVKKIELNRT